MKKNILHIIFMTMVLVSFASCNGKNGAKVPKISASPASDFKYDLNATEDGIVIYKYIGKGKTKIRIPDTIEDLPVTEIRDNAFSYYYEKTITGVPSGHKYFNEDYTPGSWINVDKSFEYIYVPRTVTIVGFNAFQSRNVKLENGQNYLYGVSGLDIDISKLEFIGGGAFTNVKFINTDILISKNLQDECLVISNDDLEEELLNENISNLYDGVIPSLVLKKLNIFEEAHKKIVDWAKSFNDDYDGNHYIQYGAGQFSGSNITSVTFEDGTEKISGNMFYRCPELVTVSIPASIKGFTYNIDRYGRMEARTVEAFANCKNLENVNFAEGIQIEYPQIDDYTSWLTGETTTYYQPVFEGCSKLSLKARDIIRQTGYKGEF